MAQHAAGHQPTSSSCDHFPSEPLDDLALVAHFRKVVGDDVVNEQFAARGTDREIAAMQRAHRAHLRALELTPTEMHRRAEMLESLMDELGVPALGSSPDTATDSDRVALFASAVLRMTDMLAEQAAVEQDVARHDETQA